MFRINGLTLFDKGELHGENEDVVKESDQLSQNGIDEEGQPDDGNAAEPERGNDESNSADSDDGTELQSSGGQEKSDVAEDLSDKNIRKRIAKLKKAQDDLEFENYRLKMEMEKAKKPFTPQNEVQKNNSQTFSAEQQYQIKLAELEQQAKVAERYTRIAPSLEISRRKYNDFDSSVSDFAKKFETIGVPEDVSDTITRLKNAGDVLYHFSKNPSDFMKVLSSQDKFDRQRTLLEMDINMENKKENVPQAPKTISSKQPASKTVVKDASKEQSVREIRNKLRGKR